MNSASNFLFSTAALAVLVVAISACASPGEVSERENAKPIGMANPASTYCISLGGKRETLKDAAGNQASICHLPDGTAIDEWTLFRRDHREP